LRWVDEKGEERDKIVKREYASHLGTIGEFKKHLLSAAVKNGYGGYGQTIILSDGAPWIRKIKEDLFPEARLILNFSYLTEEVTKFATAVFGRNGKKVRALAKEATELLLAGERGEVLHRSELLAVRDREGKDISLIKFIKDNKDYMDYPLYKERGWLIGESDIEDENKTELLKRLKQAGMRWSKESGQYILSLMSKAKSDLWESEVVKIIQSAHRNEKGR
jgi:hypothetical protein